MIDRRTPPAFRALKKVDIPNIQSSSLSNGRSVFYLEDKNTQVFKIDLILKAGSWYSNNYATVPTTLKLLNEGTQTKTAKELADTIDKFGSFLELSPGFDNCNVTLYGLSKYFDHNTKILSEVIFTPAFQQQSLTDLKRRDIQKLKLNLEKGSYLASVTLRQNTFGAQHPYGRRILPEDIEALNLDVIKEYYLQHFQDFDILLSGNLPANFLAALDNLFGKSTFTPSNFNTIHSSGHQPEKTINIKNPKFIQSSIRIGKQLFNRSHKDYMTFMLLNESLGGYFGSRLMKNIREEKGLTYGIYSQLYSLNHTGYFAISTDVNGENSSEAISEIYKEIDLLRSALIDEGELEVVKNYMTGTYAGSISSPFSIMDKFKAVHYQNLDLSFFQNYIETINSITKEEITTVAQNYLNPDSLTTITVGS